LLLFQIDCDCGNTNAHIYAGEEQILATRVIVFQEYI